MQQDRRKVGGDAGLAPPSRKTPSSGRRRKEKGLRKRVNLDPRPSWLVLGTHSLTGGRISHRWLLRHHELRGTASTPRSIVRHPAPTAAATAGGRRFDATLPHVLQQPQDQPDADQQQYQDNYIRDPHDWTLHEKETAIRQGAPALATPARLSTIITRQVQHTTRTR